MKTSNDPRHIKRMNIVTGLYALKFEHCKIPKLNTNELSIINEIEQNKIEINRIINRYSQKFNTEKMSKIDLCILQLAVFELTFVNKEPCRVIIDEAIELAKEFGSIKSPQFVNGVLGKLILEEKL
jgi:transcription antitermination protein NusB